MNKILFKNREEFSEWIKEEELEFHTLGLEPNAYPCVVVCVEVISINTLKDNLFFYPVYKKDFES